MAATLQGVAAERASVLMYGYCQAKVGGTKYGSEWAGGHRCPRLARRSVPTGYGWKVLCKQHAKREEAFHDVRV